MAIVHLEYAKSGRSNCRRCGESIAKGVLRTGEAVENSDGHFNTHYRHWGCSTPDILASLGVNTPGFHSLDAEDQKRVTEVLKTGRLAEADITELMKPAPTLPTGLAMSPSAAVTETKKPLVKSSIWAPARPGSRKRKDGPSASTAANAVAGPSGTSRLATALSSSQSSAVPSSSAATVQGSSSQVIDLTSSPAKPVMESETIQPGQVAEGRLVHRQEEEEKEEGEEEAAEPEEDVFYVRTQGEVVGIQHYPGLVGEGERVVLRRQPHNQYDANAIQVLNMYNVQVGHVPRGTASRLAGFMDKRYISVEGTMMTGNIGWPGRYKLNLLLDIYGPASNRDTLAPHLAWAGPVSLDGVAPPAYESKTGVTGTSRSPRKGKGRATSEETEEEKRARKLLEDLEGLDKGETRRDQIMDQLTKTVDVLKLPMHPDPPSVASGTLLNHLLPHQSQALLWMQQHENPSLPTGDEHVQLWQRKDGQVPHWLNIATKSPQPISQAPVLGRGGIMADAMGLGKTLTVLALVIASRKEPAPGYCGATLIVCPLSVLSNWENQISEHTPSGLLKSVVFHGEGRQERQSTLENADIVITTYNVLSSELSGSSGPSGKKKAKGKLGRLLDINWKRVVLDEGHTIRNPKAAMSRACTALNAHRRWVVSGTPIVNGAKDLGSLLAFLRICKPLDEPEQFKRLLVRNMNAGGNGPLLLQAVMTQSCLRRTKEMEDEHGNRLVALPPVNFYVVKVDLHAEDRAAYDVAMNHSKRRFQEYIETNRSGSLPPNVLQLLTRLRQLALCSALVPPNYIEDLQKEEQKHVEVEQLTEENRRALMWKLKAAIDDAEECPICFDALTLPRITMCGHCYCLECITEVIKVQAKCPMDRTNLPSLAHVLELPEVMPPKEGEEATEEGEPAGGEEAEKIDLLRSSAKIDELVKYLKAFPKGQKSLVFSQFCKFLDAIEPHLVREGINVVRFDGSMSAKARARVLSEFQKPVTAKSGKKPGDIFTASDGKRKAKKEVIEVDDSATEVSSDEEVVERKPVKRFSRKAKGKGRAIAESDHDYEDSDAQEEYGEDARSSTRPTVMLISLKSGSVGINLTAAQNVFLMDPWWSSAIEMQAIDRVNRIGQTASEVRVFQMIAKDTIEDKVLAIQAQKNELIQQAFAGNKIKETARQQKEARFAEMRELFGVDQPAQDGGQAEVGSSRLRQTTL